MHPSRHATGRHVLTSRTGLAFASTLAAVLILYPLAIQPIDALIASGRFIDDAFFYSEIAERVASGEAPSLDGIHETNGFQPLWMVVLVAARTLAPDMAAIDLIWAASLFCVVLGVFLFVFWALRDADPLRLLSVFPALLLFGLLAPPFLLRVLNGLESSLLVLMLGVWLLAARAGLRENAGLPAIAAFTAASCLLFLTRTDLFWAPILTTLAIVRRHGFAGRTLLNVFLSVALLLPYLIWNRLRFGDLVPISARVKSFYLELQYPDLSGYLASDEWRGLVDLLDHFWGGAWPAVVALALLALVLPKIRRGLPDELRLFALICLLHVAYLQVFHRELRPYTNYYFLPEAVLLMLLCVYSLRAGLARMPGRTALGPRVTAVAFLVLLVPLVWINRLPQPQPVQYWSTRVAIAERAAEIVGPETPIGAFWPGLFAHVLDGPVVPLDGIISSPRYFEETVRSGRELDYALAHGIRHLIVALPGWYDPAAPMTRAPDWPQLYLKRMADASHLEFVELASEAYRPNGSRWALLRIEEAEPRKTTQGVTRAGLAPVAP